MQQHTLEFTVVKPFGNLFRDKTVLVAPVDSGGRILLGFKDYLYPPTIHRLLGGGVIDGETFEQAATRELQEELGEVVARFVPLAHFIIRATDATGKQYAHQTRVYQAFVDKTNFTAGDDVTHIVATTPDQLFKLGERYGRLPQSLWHIDDDLSYSWADYGKMYGPIHKIVAERIGQLT